MVDVFLRQISLIFADLRLSSPDFANFRQLLFCHEFIDLVVYLGSADFRHTS